MRLFSLLFTLVLATASAQAYTVVLRSGRTVEIPDTFAVTKTSIVYEVSSGIQISIQLVSVDIPATERRNNEGPGSFLRRMNSPPAPVATTAPSTPATRSITNSDLARFKRSRQQSEIAYERRRKELGLPSVEESRLRATAETAALRERFAEGQQEEKASESYWRERAINLRMDIAAADAEIDSLRQQLDSLPDPNSLAPITLGTMGWPGYPLNPFGTVNPYYQSQVTRNRVYVSPNGGVQIRTRSGIGPVPGSRRNVFGPAYGRRDRYYGGYSPYPIWPTASPFGYQQSDPYDRTALMTRLNELIARRAGLQARWRAFEEEARRSGALPGWLRP